MSGCSGPLFHTEDSQQPEFPPVEPVALGVFPPSSGPFLGLQVMGSTQLDGTGEATKNITNSN